MNWETYLQTDSLYPLTAQQLISPRPPQPCWFPLQGFSLLEIAGPDAYKFLQGQITCDCDLLQQGSALPGAHLNLQGRIEASFIAYPLSASSVALLLPEAQASHLQALLQKYLMFSQAEFAPSSELLSIIYWGDPSARDVTAKTSYQPEHSPYLQIALLEPQALQALSTSSNRLRQGETGAGVALLSRNGLHIITAEQRGEFLPQELNYDQINAISFNKGCYKGQEIVARIHFKGQVKRRLCPFWSGAGMELPADTHLIEHREFADGKLGLCLAPRQAAVGLKPTNDCTELKPATGFQLIAPPYAIT